MDDDFAVVTVCATVRNAAPWLEASLSAISGIANLSQTCKAIIATNDNTDGTDEILVRWSSAASGRHVVRLDGLAACVPDRIDRLAHARNAYLQAHRAIGYASGLTIVLDLDTPNVNLSAALIKAAVEQAPLDWSALFANQPGRYYDLYALRKTGWVEIDPWHKADRILRLLKQSPGRQIDQATGGWISRSLDRQLAKSVLSLQYAIPPTTPFLPVRSAFGGLAIYRTAAIKNSWYGSRDRMGRTVCEHTIFNAGIENAPSGLYICPFLLNAGPPEHLGTAAPLPIPSSLIKGLA